MMLLNHHLIIMCIFMTLAFLTESQTIIESLSSFLNFFQEEAERCDIQLVDQTEYDFIIVGAGTAGCVLANRLSEITDWNVLLIEAGGNENIILDIPIFALYLKLTSASHEYRTEPSNNYCTGLENKQCHWPRGKVLGGSSAINFMIYTRGSPDDYNNWKAMGNYGWGWQDVLPYFKKIEKFNIPAHFDPKYHSKDGNVNVEYAPFQTNAAKEWVRAAQELGFKYVDYNGPEPSGVSRLQLSVKDGVRHSSNQAYLRPVKNRSNLHVMKNTLVTKLVFDQSNTTAIGVEVEKDNKRHFIYARKEVIISAGAINSPQLLMLSGIGPKEHLESMKINVMKDLPVGHNLMDHIATGGLNFLLGSPSFTLDQATINLETVFNWMKFRKSPLSLPGGCEALVYMNLKDKFNTTLSPDVELLFASLSLNSDPKAHQVFSIDKKIYAEVFKPFEKYNTFMIFPMLMRPKSKGRVLLRSLDPKIHPKLIPNYFENEEDMQKIIEGIKVAVEISKQPAMKNLGAKLYDIPIKDCLKEGDFGTDAYFACQTRKLTLTIYHQSGTCKMGVENDQTAVVDPRLKVHGIKKLRVIDASIMPEIVSVHTNAPTYMIAEKGADIIKQDWSR